MMKERALTDREKTVLQSIVIDFIQSAQPVGSRHISRKSGLDVSPATIRNTMAELEELGYLTHPHTSAGRVPTDKGYRYYVDSLMEMSQLTSVDRRAIAIHMDPNAQDIEEILKRTSQVLSRLSDELGIVFAPKFYRGILEKLELVELSSDKLLVVIHIKSGIVKTVLLEVSHRIPRERLPGIARLLNERLSGLTLSEVTRTIDERFRDIPEDGNEIIQLFVNNADMVFDFSGRGSIHMSGTNNIIRQPEMQDPKKITQFIDLVEKSEILALLLDEVEPREDDLFITIGSENKRAEIAEYSIVGSTYQYGGLKGTIAILGPTRMYYDRIASLVQITANLISEKFEHV